MDKYEVWLTDAIKLSEMSLSILESRPGVGAIYTVAERNKLDTLRWCLEQYKSIIIAPATAPGGDEE